MRDRILTATLALILNIITAHTCAAQQPTPANTPAQTPTPTPTATPAQEEQEPVKVYTQEVRLPVVAYDDRERFDPTLSVEDVLVLEDGVPQAVTSVRRVPANVLLVFDMGNQVAGTRDSQTVREASLKIISLMREGDRFAVIQNAGRSVELLLEWTTDRAAAARAVKTKYFSGNRSRLAECLSSAAAKLKEQPVGDTHAIIFTSGLESQTRDSIRSEPFPSDALQKLTETQASVHVFGFAALVQEFQKNRTPLGVGGNGSSVRVTVDMDFEMRRWFKKYARATKQREQQLQALARETGGRVLLPNTSEEILSLSEKVARDIGAQYVVTYSPKRAFDPAVGERRKAEAHSRRIGLQLFSLREVVVGPTAR
ncbi:MAG TPA: VWA domain-containing protein [Pyrinomonadaceae bacterium]|nr:VWA domain-containing protein [Pyrinomonadaceae bacterium]